MWMWMYVCWFGLLHRHPLAQCKSCWLKSLRFVFIWHSLLPMVAPWCVAVLSYMHVVHVSVVWFVACAQPSDTPCTFCWLSRFAVCVVLDVRFWHMVVVSLGVVVVSHMICYVCGFAFLLRTVQHRQCQRCWLESSAVWLLFEFPPWPMIASWCEAASSHMGIYICMAWFVALAQPSP